MKKRIYLLFSISAILFLLSSPSFALKNKTKAIGDGCYVGLKYKGDAIELILDEEFSNRIVFSKFGLQLELLEMDMLVMHAKNLNKEGLEEGVTILDCIANKYKAENERLGETKIKELNKSDLFAINRILVNLIYLDGLISTVHY